MDQPLLGAGRPATHGFSDPLFRRLGPLVSEAGLELEDLWRVEVDVAAADALLQEKLKRQSHGGGSSFATSLRLPDLVAVLWSAFWPQMLPASLFKLAADLLRYVPAYFLSQLLDLMEAHEVKSEALLLALLLPLATLGQAILVNQYFWHSLRLGAIVRTALAAALFRRTLQFEVNRQVDSGQLCNMLSSDTTRISTACGCLNMLWSAPLQLTIALVMLWRQLGLPVLAGICCMLAMLAAQIAISKWVARQRAAVARAADQRLRRTSAALQARAALKLQQWEALCFSEIQETRHAELKALRFEAILKAASSTLATIAPTMVSLTTFTVFTLLGGKLRASSVFAALALFNAMRAPLSALPELFSSLAHAQVAIVRFEQILMVAQAPRFDAEGDAADAPPIRRPSRPMPKLSPALAKPMGSLHLPVAGRLTAERRRKFGRRRTVEMGDLRSDSSSSDGEESTATPVIELFDASFSWDDAAAPMVPPPLRKPKRNYHRSLSLPISLPVSMQVLPELSTSTPPTPVNSVARLREGQAAKSSLPREAESAALRCLNFALRPGQLMAVLGGAGSGKTTLLWALLGEVPCIAGRRCVPGAARKASGRVAFCGQQPQLIRGTVRDNILFGRPYMHQNYIDALRACGLMDFQVEAGRSDRLPSAGPQVPHLSGGQRVRVGIARAIYGYPELCLLDSPFASLDPATCSLVWHAAIRGMLKNSAVVFTTTSAQLAKAADVVLVLEDGLSAFGLPSDLRLNGNFADAEADADDVSFLAQPLDLSRSEANLLVDPCRDPGDTFADAVVGAEGLPPAVLRELRALWPKTANANAAGSQSGPPVSRAKLCGAYALRFGAGGVVFVLSLFLFFASQASMVIVDCWLARWSALPVQGHPQKSQLNLLVFVLLAMLAAAIVTLQAASWPMLCLRASSRMHSEGLWCVLRAPLDVSLASVPGQLLSRFAKDLDCLDTRLPALLSQALACVAALFSAVAAIVVSSPALAPMAVMLALVMWRVAVSYSPVASDAARSVTVFNGPVVAHLMECLEGRAYLRSFGQSDNAMQHALAVLEVNARSQILNVALQRWFTLQLEIIGAVMLLCVSMTSVWRTNAHLGMSGLSLTYALTLTALAKYLVNYSTRALAQFASVERLLALSTLRPEEEVHREVETQQGRGTSTSPGPEWPCNGALELRSYQPYFAQPKVGGAVFQPLTLKVLPREHVALVGSSGAGKSTLLAGLGRLLPVAHGSLLLGDFEAREVPLQRWRKALLFVPQQPLLLAGSVRRNLDPEGECGSQEDALLWEALRLVGLEVRLRKRPGNPSEASPSPSPSSWGEASDDEQPQQSGLDLELDIDMEVERPAKVPDASPPSLRRNGASLGRILEERQSGETSDEQSLAPGPAVGFSSTSLRGRQRKLQLTGSERRLLVLARLLLRRKKGATVAILDEPFAAMEQNEVTPLHHMLKVQLAHCTMITVTHRLLPVLHFFSRILVFEEGRCVQDAPPSAALAEGQLHQLFLQAPVRLQGHVERMLALTRSEGLHAVQTLLQSVNQSTGQNEPELIFQQGMTGVLP